MQSGSNTNIDLADQNKQPLKLRQSLEKCTLEDIHNVVQKPRRINFITKRIFRTCFQYFALLDEISL